MKVYIGTYSLRELLPQRVGMAGHGRGIYRLDFDGRTGKLSMDATLEGPVSPSFLTLSKEGTRLYCVHELEEDGSVQAYAIHPKDGSLRLLSTMPTLGGSPCHVALHLQGHMLAAANYGGGSLSVFPLAEDGTLGPAQVIRHAGHGPNADRQASPHVHSSRFTADGRYVIAADLGTDTLTSYPVDGHSLSTEDMQVAFAEPGDGPRICAYDSQRSLMYTVCEMTGRIAVFACDAQGRPDSWLHSVSTLPDGASAEGNTAADVALHPNGRFLYASNRGHDSLSVYALSDDAAPAMIQNIPCGGRVPRAFTLSPDGRWLLCGNQESDTITVFAIDAEKGTLAQHSQCEVPTPVCLVFAP